MMNFNRTSLALLFVFLFGCSTHIATFLQGGSVKSNDYTPPEILVSYDAKGVAPPGYTYNLARTEDGLAIFEKNREDGRHSLIETHWQTKKGDHFAAWVYRGPAFLFVIPKDRTKKAERYAYKFGTYSLRKVDGIERPIPHKQKKKPDTVLIPR